MIKRIAALMLTFGLAGCAGSPSALAQTSPAEPSSPADSWREESPIVGAGSELIRAVQAVEQARVDPYILDAMLRRYNDRDLGLMAYHWGPERIDNWQATGQPAWPEAIDYIARINAALAGQAGGAEDARVPSPSPGFVLDAPAKAGLKLVTDPDILAQFEGEEPANDPEVRAILERLGREGELMRAVAEHVRQNAEICRGYASAIVSRTYIDEPYSDGEAFIARLAADRGLDCSAAIGGMEMVAKIAELATRLRMLQEWGQIVGAAQERAAVSSELTQLGLELMRQNVPPPSGYRQTECHETLMGFRCTTY